MQEDMTRGLTTEGEFIDYHNHKIFVPAGHFAAEALRKGHTPEGHVYHAFTRHINAGHTVLDIGANIGFHTFAMANLVGDDGRVYAVEADLSNALLLRKSVERSNVHNITIIPAAASDKVGLIKLLSSDKTNNIFSNLPEAHQNIVAVSMPLDKIIENKIDLIKIDIEGAEILALKGMKNIIEKYHPVIITEFSQYYIERTLGSNRSSEYLNIFVEAGYNCSYIRPDSCIVPLGGVEEILACQQVALRDLGWGHVDLLFS